jgi:hypothetical protein
MRRFFIHLKREQASEALYFPGERKAFPRKVVKVLASYLARNSSFLACVGEFEAGRPECGEWMDLCEALDGGAAKEGYAGWCAEREGAVPPANPAGEAGPAGQFAPDPYPFHQIIGGDSVCAIQRRVLDQWGERTPSYEVLQRSLYEAQDRFELKVEILTSELDSNGSWLERGARALENPRIKTGEESLETLGSILEELKAGGRQSPVFRS